MLNYTNPVTHHTVRIIGIDHGYGNIKTANTCFRAGVVLYEKEPTFAEDVLLYDHSYYSIGEGHKEFIADKMTDQDYFILTMAAIAKEMQRAGIRSAVVHLAVGLPLTWVSEQKERFRNYLLQKKDPVISYHNVLYFIHIVGVDVFPQGFSAIANRLQEFTGTTMLCDIGNGTMNIMTITNGKPNAQKCFTEKYGTYQCMLAVREQLLRKFGSVIDDDIIEDILRNGTADISEKYMTIIQETARQYASGIMRRLREHEYNPELMKLLIVGGGGCLIKNFGKYDPKQVTIHDDICATAKGYEFLAELRMKKAEVR